MAGRELVDPNFAHTVVLLVDYGDTGAMGLILNRPTAVGLSEALPELEAVALASDRLYEGGPVSRQVMLVLVEAAERPTDAEPVTGSLWVSGSRALVEALAAAPEGQRRRFRVYSGYAGWAPGQLDSEIARGGWHLVAGDEEMVFDPAPETLWRRVLDRDASRWAARRGMPRGSQAGGPLSGLSPP